MYNCIYIYTVYCLHQLQNFVAECLYKYHLQEGFFFINNNNFLVTYVSVQQSELILYNS